MKICALLVCFVVLSIYDTYADDNTYPFTKPVKNGNIWKYRIAIVSDNDKKSKVSENKWRSKMMKGWLSVNKHGRNNFTVNGVEWDRQILNIDSSVNSKGRAMELSELVVFNGKLYTCDDRTGIVYELMEDYSKLWPFAHLKAGDGTGSKDFKCEWMVVFRYWLVVGSIAREWVDRKGNIGNKDAFWTKFVDKEGRVVASYDWFNYFNPMRQTGGYPFPGYFSLEAVTYSVMRDTWYFLPRKGSKEAYDSVKDETRCDNILYINMASRVRVMYFGPLERERGFSSLKFLPNSDDNVFLALKTYEKGDEFKSYIGAYDVNGEVLMNPQEIGDDKFEGLEFI